MGILNKKCVFFRYWLPKDILNKGQKKQGEGTQRPPPLIHLRVKVPDSSQSWINLLIFPYHFFYILVIAEDPHLSVELTDRCSFGGTLFEKSKYHCQTWT